MYTQALNWLKSLIEQDEGVTAIEYGLIAALIAVVIIAAITVVGTELQDTFTTISDALVNANAS
ncbi:MAG: Flp family type IVb pilin [Alphaproteobacteria bacterium]|nr:Flp family type IVb pilin [Alphaproteobacteria bacterium]